MPLISGELASDGRIVYPTNSELSYTYDSSGNVISKTITQYGIRYVKRFIYNGRYLQKETMWEPH